MITSEFCCSIFLAAIEEYHRTDDIDRSCPQQDADGMDGMLFRKSWIDTVQWHLEDVIRRTDLSPDRFIETKRRIDHSNQLRTDLVEKIDDWFLGMFRQVTPEPQARLNTETPAWVVDRLSILMLKIYHMEEQTRRTDASESHVAQCRQKLGVLMEQKLDLCSSLNDLLDELAAGKARMKVYRQMKMYNDPSTNPQLYQS